MLCGENTGKRKGRLSPVYRIVRVGDYLAVVTQLQSTGGSSQRCPGFNSW